MSRALAVIAACLAASAMLTAQHPFLDLSDEALQQSMSVDVADANGTVVGRGYFVGSDSTSAYFVTASAALEGRTAAIGSLIRGLIRFRGGKQPIGATVRGFDSYVAIVSVPLSSLPKPLPTAFVTTVTTQGAIQVMCGDGRIVMGQIANEKGPYGDDTVFTTTLTDSPQLKACAGGPILTSKARRIKGGDWVGIHVAATPANGIAVSSTGIRKRIEAWGLHLVDYTAEILKSVREYEDAQTAVRVNAINRLAQLYDEAPAYRDEVQARIEWFLSNRDGLLTRNGLYDPLADHSQDRPAADPDVRAALAILLVPERVRASEWKECEPLLGTPQTCVVHHGRSFSFISFQGAILPSAFLEASDLQAVSFNFAELRRATFRDAVLSHATFLQANLTMANLTGVRALETQFDKAVLDGAMLTRANVKAASFVSSSLRRTDFTDADVDKTNFTGAHVEGANFALATNLTQSQLESAIGDRQTRVPANLRIPSSWP